MNSVIEKDKKSAVDNVEAVFSITPEQKSNYVQTMFDSIAGSYDLVNSLLSIGIHKAWRNYAIRCAALVKGDSVLDACSGTGELSTLARNVVGENGQVVAVDFSLPMLRAGNDRFTQAETQPLQVDILDLPFADNSFDAALIAFGLRNVVYPQAGLKELARVVKPGGRVVVLEFSSPKIEWFNKIFELYSKTIMPYLGGMISGRRDAYSYLPESVRRWHSRSELCEMMRNAGLSNPRYNDLTFGVACVHVGTKPNLDCSAGKAINL